MTRYSVEDLFAPPERIAAVIERRADDFLAAEVADTGKPVMADIARVFPATIELASVAIVIGTSLGIPLGIWMAKSNRVQSAITPVLDIMQTIPSFVYLIPVVMLLGIGKVPGLIAVCIYAIPPIVRLTNLGIRLVDKEVLEAADAFGDDYRQKLFGVQIPLALPNIFAGVNQTIMMSLAMVVIASMIGVKGLGLPVLRAISNQYLALGLLNGLAIVTLAIIFDRVSQEYGRRLQAHRQGPDHD